MSDMVITGIGIVSAFADTPDELYGALQKGIFTGGDAPMPAIKKRHGLVFTDNITKKLYAAYERAIEDSGFIETDKSKMGIFLGNALGSLGSIVDFEMRSIEKGYKAVLPMGFINTVMNAPAGQLAILSGYTGMNITVSDGSSASAAAMAYCADMLAEDRVDAAVTGGAEEISEIYGKYIKHFGAEPSGGVCVFTAERRDRAVSRGAHIYAVWKGGVGAYYPQPRAQDIYEVMNSAVSEAGVSINDIDFIVTSCGAGELLKEESKAVSRINCPVLDIKAVIGETYGASGAFGAAAAAAAIRRQKLPDGTPLGGVCRALVICVGFDGYISSFVLEK